MGSAGERCWPLRIEDCPNGNVDFDQIERTIVYYGCWIENGKQIVDNEHLQHLMTESKVDGTLGLWTSKKRSDLTNTRLKIPTLCHQSQNKLFLPSLRQFALTWY